MAVAETVKRATSPSNLAEGAAQDGAADQRDQLGARGARWCGCATAGEPRLEITFGAPGEREQLGRSVQRIMRAVFESARARRSTGRPRSCCCRRTPRRRSRAASCSRSPPTAVCSGSSPSTIRITRTDRARRLRSRRPRVFLDSLVDLLALAVDQAGRFEEVARAGTTWASCAPGSRRVEKFAVVGEMTARLARSARSPLGSIRTFAARAHQSLAARRTSAARYLEIVERETDRLERLIGGSLDHLATEPARLRMESLNEVIRKRSTAPARTLVRRRIRLLKKLTPDLPRLLLDAEQIHLVVMNLMDNARSNRSRSAAGSASSPGGSAGVVVEGRPRRRPRARRIAGADVRRLRHRLARLGLDRPPASRRVSSASTAARSGAIRRATWDTIVAFTLPVRRTRTAATSGTTAARPRTIVATTRRRERPVARSSRGRSRSSLVRTGRAVCAPAGRQC